jgi:hypothetical protein
MEVSYNYITVDYTNLGEYPIKTVQEAWDELTSGGGYVAAFEGPSAIVRRVVLGYYDTTGDQKYEMPIYVFSGDNGLVAYVSAVSKEVLAVPTGE